MITKRATKTKRLIRETILSMNGAFSVEELYLKMKHEDYRISRATLYNNINLMWNDGVIERLPKISIRDHFRYKLNVAETIDVKKNEMFAPTMHLRILVATDYKHESTRTLQQKHINYMNGRVEWRDIEVVQSEV